MTVATSEPVVPKRLRIAISSPDILAQIQYVFASKNLALEITGLPYVEVTVQPVANAAAADRSAIGSAVQRLVGPGPRPGAAAPRRLCAEYRLNVVEVGDGPKAEHAAPAARRHLAVVPEPDADDPAPALSPRQREVMAMVSRGARNPEIAAALRVSEKTVKNHINRIFRALGASSRVEAVLIWQRHQPAAARRDVPGAATWRDASCAATGRDGSRPAGDRGPARAGTP